VLERSVTAARMEFAALANRVMFTEERVIITRYGRPAMALVPVTDLVVLGLIDGSGNVAQVDVAQVDVAQVDVAQREMGGET
jgi:prevent-host-death family protein